MGKGTSGGYFSLSAMATRAQFVERLKEGSGGFVHGHTYTHHPVACAVGLAVLGYLQREHLIKRAEERGFSC